jgi:hypothetical protein
MPAFARFRSSFGYALALLTLLAPGPAFAASCTTQGQMAEADRNTLVQTARTLATSIQSGNAAAVQALTIPKVKAQFEGIASTIEQTAPLLKGATITIDAVYGLDASDLKTAEEDTTFYCSAAGSPLHVDVSIPQLPKGMYAMALVHATGVQQPQQMALLLQKSGDWQLAGLFIKPLQIAAHDSVWYWTQGRAFAQKGQKWNAYFYLQTAAYLATPADLLTSTNLDKLKSEAEAVRPPGLSAGQPMTLSAGAKNYSLTDLHTDGSLGGLDLVVRYTATDASDPVATRAVNLDVMKAMLAAHPELHDAFHGLWVFAEAPNQRPFGNEVAMGDIH